VLIKEKRYLKVKNNANEGKLQIYKLEKLQKPMVDEIGDMEFNSI